MQALIFAAGKGTRLRPLTDNTPKALVNIGGQPLLGRLIEKLRQQGFERVVVNVHHFGEQIIEYLRVNDNFGLDISVSDERSQLLDTGGGLLNAEPLFDKNRPILIHNVDILSNIDLKDLYFRHDPKTLATLVVSNRNSSRCLLVDKQNIMRGWRNILQDEEIVAPMVDREYLRQLAFAGIHVVSPEIFDVMRVNYSGVFPIMKFYISAMADNTISCYEPQSIKVMDVGKIGEIDKAEAFAAQL